MAMMANMFTTLTKPFFKTIVEAILYAKLANTLRNSGKDWIFSLAKNCYTNKNFHQQFQFSIGIN
jgi:hypothetical protein